MKNRLLQTENLSIERHTKLRMLNLVIALILLFAFVAIRIYRIQHHQPQITNRLVIRPNEDENTYTALIDRNVRDADTKEEYAWISFNEQQFWLEKTGTLPIYINNRKINSKRPLKDRDIVCIGSTPMWFQTVPSMMKRRIIYRQPRRDKLQITFGSDVKRCDIVMSAPIKEQTPLMPKSRTGEIKPRLMTLTFNPDRYTVTAHSEIPVKLPLREIAIEKGGQDFENIVADTSSQELLILGSTKIVFSYKKDQEMVEIAVLEVKETTGSIWQANFTIPRNGQQVSLSKEHPLTIMGEAINRQKSGFLSSAKEMFFRNSLKFYAAIIVIGFISFPLTRRSKVIKYLVFWLMTFGIVLGSALIFGESQSDQFVEGDFLVNVKAAIDRRILFLDNKNHIQLKNQDAELWRAITTKKRDIREFIKAHNDFIQSNGRVGQEWFLIDEKNRQILGLKREAVTIKNFRRLQNGPMRGRFFDRNGKSIAKLKVIESNNKGLKPGAEIWLNIPHSKAKYDIRNTTEKAETLWRKDIILLNNPEKKESQTLLNIDKLRIVLYDGKLMLNNARGDQNLTWYTKIKVSSKGKIYDYPVLRKIRPNMVFIIDYNEGRGIIGNEEIIINQINNQIKLNNLIILDAEKCFEINAGDNFPPSGKFQNHLSMTQHGEVCYVQNLGVGDEEILVSGRILTPKEERELQPYDFIRIGHLLLEYIPEGDGLLAGNLKNGQRYYPVDLSQTIGYFCYPDLKGNLEKTFDRILAAGKDIVLTIDDDLQRIVIDELKLGLQKAGLKLGTAVLLDVETGDILALASEPSYDQNDRNEIFAAFRTDKIEPRKSPILNRALHKLYPPGSFFKLVIASAALENSAKMPGVRDFIRQPLSHGFLTRKVVLSSLTPSKKHVYAIHPLKDHDHKIHENIYIHEALAESCNVYFAALAIQLGYNSLNRAYYPPQNPLYTSAEEAYLFNEKIDLLPLQIKSDMGHKQLSNLLDRRRYDILNPFSSQMPNNRLHPSDLSRVGIGQFDIRITPLEAALILSTIANDGIRHLPRLVKAIHGVQSPNLLWKGKARSQIEVEFLPGKGKRVISSKTARELKKMMREVVTDGTASYEFKYSTLNDNIAGKTGTPTAPDMTSKYHSIFGAIAPITKQANKPQVALVVFGEYGESASLEVVPIARRILEKIAVYYGWR